MFDIIPTDLIVLLFAMTCTFINMYLYIGFDAKIQEIIQFLNSQTERFVYLNDRIDQLNRKYNLLCEEYVDNSTTIDEIASLNDAVDSLNLKIEFLAKYAEKSNEKKSRRGKKAPENTTDELSKT